MFKEEGYWVGILIIALAGLALFMIENPGWEPKFNPPPKFNRPEILIIRETTESQYGEPVIILDYMVGGIATNAIFYHYQMNEYDAVMKHLHRIGRLRYASPMITPMGGQ